MNNWRYQYNGSSEQLTISREVNDVGSRRFCNPDLLTFVTEYTKSRKSNAETHKYWNEKLGDFGRIVFDFDIKRGTDEYRSVIERYPLNENNEPQGYMAAIQDLIIQSLQQLNRHREVEILKKDEIEWYSNDILNIKRASPFCWVTGCRPEKISYHLYLPFISCIYVSVDKDGYTEDISEGSQTLTIIMKELYDMMKTLAQDSYLLPDNALLTRNHEIRLPGFTKYRSDGSDILRFVGEHNILHALSCIYPSYVPSELHYIVDNQKVIEKICNEHSSNNDVIDPELKDQIWKLVPDEVKENYIDIKYKDDTFMLIPKGKDSKCPVCCRCHERNNPHISAYDGTYILTCWQWVRLHRHDDLCQGPIPIGQYGNITMKEDIRRKIASRSIERHKCISASNSEKKHLIHIKQQDIMNDIIGEYDLYIKSAMGTGKTKLLNSILTDQDEYIIISNRVMQAHKYSRLFPDATLYGESGWSMESVKRLIVQMESLHHSKRSAYKYVILDEIESLLRLLISETMRGKELQTVNRIIDIVSRCERLVVMDAFLKQSTIEWLKSIRINKEYRIVINDFKQIERSGERIVNVIFKRTEFVAQIRDDDTKKVIACLSKSVANSLYDMLVQKGENTLIITGDSPDVLKRMDPHDKNGGWDRYHNIIYTSASSNSISFEKEHFDTLYVYGCKGSAGPEELAQMCGRVRQLKNNNIYVYCSRAWYRRSNDEDDPVAHDDTVVLDEYLPMTEKSVMDDMKRIASYPHIRLNTHLLSDVWNVLDERIRNLYARLYTDRGTGQRFLNDILLCIMKEEMGWSINREYIYHREQKLKKSPKIVSEIDKSIYDSYVDSQWENALDVYHNVWTKNRSNEIRNIASMARYKKQGSSCKEHNIGQKLYADLNDVFTIGGQDLNECIKSRKSDIVLRFTTLDSSKLKPLLVSLGSYTGKVPNNRIWEWMHNYISQHLLMKCDKDVGKSSGNRIYIYEIDLTDWIYYHIRW